MFSPVSNTRNTKAGYTLYYWLDGRARRCYAAESNSSLIFRRKYHIDEKPRIYFNKQAAARANTPEPVRPDMAPLVVIAMRLPI